MATDHLIYFNTDPIITSFPQKLSSMKVFPKSEIAVQDS